MENKIPFGTQLICLALLEIEFLKHEAKKYRLASYDFLFLMFPELLPGINQEQMSIYFNIHKSTIGRCMAKLETKGLIVRTKNPNNLRSYNIELTQKGHELTVIIKEAMLKFEEKISPEATNFDVFKDDTKKMFLKALYTRQHEKNEISK